MPWQAALQATMRYVWFLDDDVIPGLHALAFLLHVSNARPYRDALLGGRGSCVWPGLLSHPDFLIRRGSTYREGVESVMPRKCGLFVSQKISMDRALCCQVRA